MEAMSGLQQGHCHQACMERGTDSSDVVQNSLLAHLKQASFNLQLCV